MHRLRSVLVRPGRERLSGAVEVDETFIGGEEPGLAGGRARGTKALVGVAVEVLSPKGFGRCRMAILDDASAATLHRFVADHIESGATVITDGWSGLWTLALSGGVLRSPYIASGVSPNYSVSNGLNWEYVESSTCVVVVRG